MPRLLPFLKCKFVNRDLKDNGYESTLGNFVVVQILWCLSDSNHWTNSSERRGCFRMLLFRQHTHTHEEVVEAHSHKALALCNGVCLWLNVALDS